jgi:hypothetical protein
MNRPEESPGPIGIAWYRADQWKRLREVSSDPERLEKTWYEWYQVAEQNLQELTASGLALERVAVDVEDLARWCKAQGIVVDGHARAQYVAELLRLRDQGHDPA